jgi:hypothetical protein
MWRFSRILYLHLTLANAVRTSYNIRASATLELELNIIAGRLREL